MTSTRVARSPLRAVAVPAEHGGWGLTAEPVLLGLLVAPSVAGGCLGLAAVVTFVAHTPLRVALVDRHRHRDLERTRLARRVLLIELAAVAALVAVAARTASAAFWWPAVVAVPLVIVALWFDTRSRSRRLAPELAGTIGISSVTAMIIFAGGGDPAVAWAAWLIFSARASTSIPHVRALIARLHGRSVRSIELLVADAAALVVAGLAVVVTIAASAGAVAVVAVVAVQRLTAAKDVAAKVVGLRQLLLGLAVVAATAIGFHLA
jgi:hypothetical protein